MITGNTFWKNRTTHGRTKLFSDAQVLIEEARAYFHWCDTHPWYRAELVKYKGDFDEAEVPLGRPYSMDGLTVYLAVSGSYFRSAKANLKDKVENKKATEEEVDLLDAIEWIEAVIRTQNIEGASVGVFNPNIIARIHQLAENVNNNNTGDAVLRVTVRDQKTAENIDALDDLL